MLETLEAYYDAAPRPLATTEEVGPFTLFLRAEEGGFPYYARPRLAGDATFAPADVEQVLDRQRELGVPRAIEWVHETTPSLLPAARTTNALTIEECPLLVLQDHEKASAPTGFTVERLSADGPRIGDVQAALHASFGHTDEVGPSDPGNRASMIDRGLLTLVGAFDADGRAVGGGSHGPRGRTTELTGIAVIPRARKHGVGQAITSTLVADALGAGIETVFLAAASMDAASVYERVGFRRTATACIAEAR
ncbi:GNAT family N-acetyltransferase [Luteipulveratus halotolerans]|uniref:GNAT family N-acetyltransferase n=1 Tax=Luteipulveratus halotolerans TaxID=1631356 RepID=UPI000680707B|nr:GNAT family N-acetyltransferase [Luteipulveratus halotolerans]